MNEIKIDKFKNIDINDKFFDSLKSSYQEFEEWYTKRGEKKAFYLSGKDGIQGFLYLKPEEEIDNNIFPVMEKKSRIKIGTFKIDAHGTKLGERFIKLIFDSVLRAGRTEGYLTVFEEHRELIRLLKKYGFKEHGIKKSQNGEEKVLVKKFDEEQNDVYLDYPRIDIKNRDSYMLSIKPEYHTKMFPDSKLATEKNHIVRDLSYTNSIEKIYLSGAWNAEELKPGDILIIYRTKDKNSAEYSSVATSVCTVKEIKSISEFDTYESFEQYCRKNSIFKEEELKEFWQNKSYKYLITMLYNTALSKRIIRKKLADEVGITRDRLVLEKLTNEQLMKILELGGVNENLIINKA